MNHKPIDPKYRQHMNAVAQALDETFNGQAKGKDRKVGFVLLVFEFGEAEAARCNYISNGADRKDIISLFREMAARFEGQPYQEGNA